MDYSRPIPDNRLSTLEVWQIVIHVVNNREVGLFAREASVNRHFTPSCGRAEAFHRYGARRFIFRFRVVEEAFVSALLGGATVADVPGSGGFWSFVVVVSGPAFADSVESSIHTPGFKCFVRSSRSLLRLGQWAVEVFQCDAVTAVRSTRAARFRMRPEIGAAQAHNLHHLFCADLEQAGQLESDLFQAARSLYQVLANQRLAAGFAGNEARNSNDEYVTGIIGPATPATITHKA